MAKKLLGGRSIGDKSYDKDQIISDEEFAASGLTDADVVTVDVPAPAPQEEQAQVHADAHADLDSAGNASAQGGSDADAPLVIPHTVTELNHQQGKFLDVEVGTIVEVPAENHIVTEQDLIDNPEYAAAGIAVGTEILREKVTE